jgi:hypothetical protein
MATDDDILDAIGTAAMCNIDVHFDAAAGVRSPPFLDAGAFLDDLRAAGWDIVKTGGGTPWTPTVSPVANEQEP